MAQKLAKWRLASTASITLYERVPLLRMRMSGEYNLDMHVDDAHVDVGGEYSLYNWFGVVFKYIFF